MADDSTASATLDTSQLAALDALGTRQWVAKGEYLYRAGDAAYDFYVIVSGAVDIIADSGDTEVLIARHGGGRFLGELNLLTGLRVLVSARVAEPGEVTVVPVAALRRVID
jgi:thioredoxin reductase (NADPH)